MRARLAPAHAAPRAGATVGSLPWRTRTGSRARVRARKRAARARAAQHAALRARARTAAHARFTPAHTRASRVPARLRTSFAVLRFTHLAAVSCLFLFAHFCYLAPAALPRLPRMPHARASSRALRAPRARAHRCAGAARWFRATHARARAALYNARARTLGAILVSFLPCVRAFAA